MAVLGPMLFTPDEKYGPAQEGGGEVATEPVSESPWASRLWSGASGEALLGPLNVPGKLRR